MSDSTRINPYASPQAEEQRPVLLASRHNALSIVRRTLIILAVPFAVNIWATFFWTQGADGAPRGFLWMLLMANVFWLLFLFAVLWTIGLWLIELPARLLHVLFGGTVSRESWMTSLHHSLWPMVPAALIGAVLWVAWLCLFHFADHSGGFALDAAFQVAGHALGAWVYGSVFWHWHLLRRERSAKTV